METKHTKGKWEINITDELVNGLPTIEVFTPTTDDSLGEWIARVRGNNPEQREANAKLIAAAPILYNAAYSALQAIYAMPKKKQAFYQYLINDLLNAIQKANGIII